MFERETSSVTICLLSFSQWTNLRRQWCDRGTCHRRLGLLKFLESRIVERITVVKFGMNNLSSDRTGCCFGSQSKGGYENSRI